MTLFASHSLDGEMDELVVKSLPLARTVIPPASSTLHMREATSYTAFIARGENKEMRLFVALRLLNMSSLAWTARGVAVLAGGAELKGASVLKAEPIPPGKVGRVVVQFLATQAQARSPFTLTLRDESGERTLKLGNVTFP